jgi:hypothetical protein
VKCIQNFSQKPERKRAFARTRSSSEDNIKVELKEIGRGNVGWIHVTQDRNQWRVLVITIMNSGLST